MFFRPNSPALFILFIICTFLSCTPKYTHGIKSLNGKGAAEHIEQPATQVSKHIYVDSRFDDEQRSAIRAASEAWERASGNMIKYYLEYDYDVDVSKVSGKIVIVYLGADDELTRNLDDATKITFKSGYMKMRDAEYILLCPDRLYDLYNAAERELGHELGLKTLDSDISGVMNDSDKTTTCPSTYDMIEFCNIFLCDIDKMKHCEIK